MVVSRCVHFRCGFIIPRGIDDCVAMILAPEKSSQMNLNGIADKHWKMSNRRDYTKSSRLSNHRSKNIILGLGYEPLIESFTLWGAQDAALVLVKRLACRGHSGYG